jgi:hypothetical protein
MEYIKASLRAFGYAKDLYGRRRLLRQWTDWLDAIGAEAVRAGNG